MDERSETASDPAVQPARLLETIVDATERILSDAFADTPLETLGEAMASREQAVDRLREIAEAEGWRPNPAERAFLDRLRELDQELLTLGASLPERLQGQRHALHRRRSAIQAHAARGRDEPRVLTVKA